MLETTGSKVAVSRRAGHENFQAEKRVTSVGRSRETFHVSNMLRSGGLSDEVENSVGSGNSKLCYWGLAQSISVFTCGNTPILALEQRSADLIIFFSTGAHGHVQTEGGPGQAARVVVKNHLETSLRLREPIGGDI